MGKIQNEGEEAYFIRDWWSQKESYTFLRFDIMIIRELGFSVQQDCVSECIRRAAFLKFRKLTGHYPFATMPTMRRWFGLGSFRSPGREKIYEICLQLGLGVRKAQEYLTIALGEVSFQFRDYREVFFVYGLEKKLSISECYSLIERFEKEREPELVSGTLTEQEFEKQLQINKRMKQDKFLSWMLSCQNFFIGYRESVTKILQECRQQVVNYIRRDAKDKLESLLAETNYKNWLNKRQYRNLETREILKRFVKAQRKGNYKEVSQNMSENILELSALAYSPMEPNSKLLAEVFSRTGRNFLQIRGMSSKHLSDLFNVSMQWERMQTMKHVKCKLESADDISECPDSYIKMVERNMGSLPEKKTVKKIREAADAYIHEQKRRCLDVKRSDILPMIHYIAQRRCLDDMEANGEEYSAKKARHTFKKLANGMLKSCHMAEINEELKLDAILLACFQPEEMYSYAEILEYAREDR